MKRASVFAGIAVFAVIGVVAGYLAFRGRLMGGPHDPGAGGGFEPATAVVVVDAGTIPFRQEADLTGTVIALRQVTISNEVAGIIKGINFDSGAVVEAGQTLLTLDDATERADLESAQAMVRVAEANVGVADARLKLAQSEVNRLADATKTGAAPAMDLDRANAEFDKARADRERWVADVDQSKAAVAQVRTRLDKHVIKAPFKGRLGLRQVHPGQYLKEGTEIVALHEVGGGGDGKKPRIYLDFAIPQEHIARVQPGTSVTATCPLLGAAPITIDVVALDAAVNYETRNVRVRAIVDNPGDMLRQGMAVPIKVPLGVPVPMVAVPSTAIRRASFGDHVFIIAPDPKDAAKLRAVTRMVKLGPAIGNDVIVLDGVKAGERVATEGSFKLRAGALVVPGGGSAASNAPPK